MLKQTSLSLIAVLLLSLLITACGSNDASPEMADDSVSQDQEAQQEIAAGEVNVAPLIQSTSMAGDPASSLAANAPGGAPLPAQPLDQTQTNNAPPADMFFENYGVNPAYETSEDNLSTFAMDVDTASYTLTRSYLMDYDQLPDPAAVRPEEFINYFDVNYPSPADENFAIHLAAAPAPFGAPDQLLLRVGIQGRYISPEDRSPALLLFVIDVSGSMDMENRLGLVKESLALLVDELREDDRVGIAVYSDNSRIVLQPTPASEKQVIMSAINALRPEGSTNAEAGIRLGYQMAANAHRDGEITRVILLSDGVANVGITGSGGILEAIQREVDNGVTLSAIGFGMGNYNDVLMEQLANDGNGNYFYVDTLREARRVFVHNLTGTLQVIAYDAKIQVEFNPDVTANYRLIGYENRDIADEDFRDDTVDAGEIGAGHSITALYEITLQDAAEADKIATVFIRYQDAESEEVVEVNQAITTDEVMPSFEESPADFRLHAVVAELSELLRDSYWAEGGNYVDLITVANAVEADMPNNDDVTELIEMVRAAGRIVDNVGG